MSMKLNDLCKIIKSHNEALFLQIPKITREQSVAGGSDDNGSQAAGRYERKKNNNFFETIFTGCKDDDFINVSWVENKLQFEYSMNAFNQEVYIPDLLAALNVHNLKSDKEIKSIQNKFNLSFSKQKNNDIDTKDDNSGKQIQNLNNLSLNDFNLPNISVDPTLSKCRNFLAKDKILQKNLEELRIVNPATNYSIEQFLMENDDAFID